MCADLKAALVRLEAALRKFGAPIVENFRPGADPAYVRETLAAEGLAAPDDLIAWWGWHDGTSAPRGTGTDPEATLVGPWTMPTLEHTIRHRREMIAIDRDVSDEPRLPETWLPVAMSNDSDLCADTSASSAPALYILDFETMDEPYKPHFASLTSFVGALTQALEEGLVGAHPFDARAPWLGGNPQELPPELRRLVLF
jgi:hypothetical protein